MFIVFWLPTNESNVDVFPGEDHYLSFGLSGSPDKTQMLGSDVAIAYIDGYRGFANDYNITSNSPVSPVIEGSYVTNIIWMIPCQTVPVIRWSVAWWCS